MLQDFDYNNKLHKELILKILKDTTVSKYMNLVEIMELIELNIVKKYILVVEEECVGIAFIIPLKGKEVEIRYCIEKSHRGKHYSNILVQKLMETIDKGYIVYADIQSDNYASKKAALNCGFTTDDDFVYKAKR